MCVAKRDICLKTYIWHAGYSSAWYIVMDTVAVSRWQPNPLHWNWSRGQDLTKVGFHEFHGPSWSTRLIAAERRQRLSSLALAMNRLIERVVMSSPGHHGKPSLCLIKCTSGHLAGTAWHGCVLEKSACGAGCKNCTPVPYLVQPLIPRGARKSDHHILANTAVLPRLNKRPVWCTLIGWSMDRRFRTQYFRN